MLHLLNAFSYFGWPAARYDADSIKASQGGAVRVLYHFAFAPLTAERMGYPLGYFTRICNE